MQATVEIVLPVFGLVLCGYLVGRTRLFTEAGIKGLNNFVFWVAIPALLFRSMSTLKVPEALDGEIVIAYFLSCLIVFGGALLFGRRLLALKYDEAAMFGMGGVFGNTIMIGVPLVLLAFGDEGLLALLFIISFHPLILITVPTAVIELARGDGGSVGAILVSALRSLLKNPIILGMLSGLVWRQTGLGLWGPAETLIDMLRDGATPTALFAVGATMTTFKIAGNLKHSLIVVLVKLAVLPSVVWVMTTYVFGLDPLWASVATVAAALPTGINPFLLASTYNVYVARMTTATLISTALAVLTVGLLIGVLAPA